MNNSRIDKDETLLCIYEKKDEILQKLDFSLLSYCADANGYKVFYNDILIYGKERGNLEKIRLGNDEEKDPAFYSERCAKISIDHISNSLFPVSFYEKIISMEAEKNV